ncbi:hypothetical protein [Chloroflexus sp.]|uniref:hypothetical protein n=1 Tax=Chloroflexus sp. TaxID=1904827 RepID=UPI00262B82B4|nr:hypothetical protein [uncultured Chloroflexus sp.]
MKQLIAWFIVIFLLSSCNSFIPPSSDQLNEPFRSAWQAAGGARIGPPLGEPRWVDNALVQYFNTIKIVALENGGAVAEQLPADWRAHTPAAVIDMPPAPQRAALTSALSAQPVQPLQPVAITVQVPGYDGMVTVQLYDAAANLVAQGTALIVDGSGEIALPAGGVLGPQWAVALIDGQLAGAQSQIVTLDAQTTLVSGQGDIDSLYPRIRRLMAEARVSYELNGRFISGYRSPDNPLLWLRDHVYQGRGFRYFEQDVTSLLDAFRDAQLPDGSLPDVIDYPERYVKAFRKEVESDVEFLYIQGVYEAWQMTGNDEWLRSHLPALRRAVEYITTNPLRWNADRGLVRRPYTIDMWDFAYGPTTISPDGKPAPRHWIEPDTIWGTFHGDNTGLAYALFLLARIEQRVGDPERGERYFRLSDEIMQRLNALAWNGRFFTHFIPEDPTFTPTGVDAAEQLSLSNAYALNRRVLSVGQAQAIVESYYGRRDFSRSFAEWYSIDPPFPPGSFGMAGGKGEQPGEYVNGGIMPLVGGELARGAFTVGFEPYGLDILRRYANLLRLTNASYLWYYPDGRPGISGPDTIPTDGWGASAMLGALFEGLAGITDEASRYDDVIISPRWPVESAIMQAYVVARYPASDGYVAYRWHRDGQTLRLQVTGSGRMAYVRLMLPPEAGEEVTMAVAGQPVTPVIEKIGLSRYAGVALDRLNVEVTLTWP